MRRLALLSLILLSLVTACGDTPYDPYAAQKAALSWDSAQFFDTLGRVAWGGALLVGGLVALIGLYWLAGQAWWSVSRAAKDVQLTLPDGQGQVPYPTAYLLTEPGLAERASRRRARVALTAAAASQAVPTSYTYHNAPVLSAPADAPLLPPGEAAPLELPGPCSLLDVLRDWTPSADAILLGLGPGGQRLTVPADDTMCHLLLAGQTGRGKSVLFRLLMTQLILAGVDVRWWDLAYAPFDNKRRIDLRPLAARVTGGPVTDPAAINQFFATLAGAELSRRKAHKAATGDAGPPFVVFADEWPQLIHAHPELADPAARCLRIYRQYNGYFAVGSQDGLVETMGLNSGELGQFATRYYVGGADDTTRRRLTGSSKNPDPPGKGLVYLSAAPLPQPDVVRVPNVRNLDLYELLGWPSTPPPWGWELPPRQTFPTATVVEGTARPAPPMVPLAPDLVARFAAVLPLRAPPVATDSPDTANVATSSQVATDPAPPTEGQKAAQLWLHGYDWVAIVKEVKGVGSDEGGRFTKATRELQAAARAAMQEAGVTLPWAPPVEGDRL